MNKKFIISLSLVIALSATVAAYADSTIYTDGIGRIHFLGRDAANNIHSGANYSNSANQDLTRKLYERAESGVVEDTDFNQHPLKNYENTFPDSRYSTTKYWKPKTEEEANYEKSVKATTTTTKGQTDYSGLYQYGSTVLDNTSSTPKKEVKKHWWNRNK